MSHNRLKIVLVMALFGLFAGCAATVDETELLDVYERAVLSQGEFWYTGTSDSYDYFLARGGGVSGWYRASIGEVRVVERFPLTKDEDQWQAVMLTRPDMQSFEPIRAIPLRAVED